MIITRVATIPIGTSTVKSVGGDCSGGSDVGGEGRGTSTAKSAEGDLGGGSDVGGEGGGGQKGNEDQLVYRHAELIRKFA
eukprot:CAMPEP_0182801588 /NCGR_PEP_ID=MMETSP0006_2-20121128/3034_1 /TAXON_ID=97485 /ORGANISM="Prymnesium parvum, Strain Texoma1" /LENGTH=79 /DNA_ID=CAMNT_0024926923 /DNA_START=366 /DNA_END=605 /DNA_ORIENTATION=+